MAEFTTDDLDYATAAAEWFRRRRAAPNHTAEELHAVFEVARCWERVAAKQARADAKADRKERAIILQAKILEMRRQLEEAQPD